MFIVSTYGLAVLFCLITMLCWGSWANTQKLAAAQWRFELFYWDYVLGILLTALLLAGTLGSTGDEGRPFLADLAQADRAALGLALWGGVLFNAANILLSAAIAIAGMAVAFPVGIGLALVIGVVVNYLQVPLGNAALLFTGVGLVLAAVVLNALAYQRTAPTGTAAGQGRKGLLLSIVAGALMGFFYKYVAASMAPDFARPAPGLLTPYTALVLFAGGIFLSNLLFNTLLMYRPFTGEPTSPAAYFRGSARDHLMGLLGGLIWMVGMSLSILASEQAGPAISYGLGQGATVVAAIWGIFVWREFRGASPATMRLLYAMLLCYVLGLAVIILAR
jgi:glucose uptake protein